MRFPQFRLLQFVLKRSLLLCLAIVVPYFIITSLMRSPHSSNTAGVADFFPAEDAEESFAEDDASYASQRREKLARQYSLKEALANNNSSGTVWDIDIDQSNKSTADEHVAREEFIEGHGENLTGGPSTVAAANLSTYTAGQLPRCPAAPPGLVGKMKQDVLLVPTLKESYIMHAHPELHPGGHWKPLDCVARHKLAIIIPFRDRQSHLNRLLEFLIPMLERQQIDFRFIVTEQYGHDLFNKGKIMNAAFLLAERLGVDCVCFHDVDLFPQDDRSLYWCPPQPLHLGAYVNTLGYELWYNYLAGGVLLMRTEHYRSVNGYSNLFWAWGGEDDDMGYRILAQNYSIDRPDKITGRFTMLKHIKRARTAPKMIYKLLKTASTRWPTDGVNVTDWRVLKVIQKPLYYHIFIDVGSPPKEWREGGG